MRSENEPSPSEGRGPHAKWPWFKQCRGKFAALGLLAALAALSVYYYSEWRTVQGMVESIDICDRPLCDFGYFYLPMGRDFLLTERPVYGFFYSAFFALFLVPFGWLSDSGALAAWGALQVLCLLILLLAPLRRLLRPSANVSCLYVLLVATSVPVFHNLAWGQVSVLVVAGLFCAFDAYVAKRRILAGCFLALVAAIKFYPVMFVVYFLFKRDIRSLAAFCLAGFIFYVALPVGAMGVSDWLSFEFATKKAIVGSLSEIRDNENTQYIAHVGLRYARLYFPDAANALLGQVLAGIGFVVAGLNVALVWLLCRRRVPGETGLALVALLLAQPFLIRTSWPHYFCFLPFCQALLLGRLCPDWRASLLNSILFTLTALSAVASSTLLFNAFPHWSDYSMHGLLFISTALLLPSLYVIAYRESKTVERTDPGDCVDRQKFMDSRAVLRREDLAPICG